MYIHIYITSPLSYQRGHIYKLSTHIFFHHKILLMLFIEILTICIYFFLNFWSSHPSKMDFFFHLLSYVYLSYWIPVLPFFSFLGYFYFPSFYFKYLPESMPHGRYTVIFNTQLKKWMEYVITNWREIKSNLSRMEYIIFWSIRVCLHKWLQWPLILCLVNSILRRL